MNAREKVARKVKSALESEGFKSISLQRVYDGIWSPSGGERQLDIARWDVTVKCEHDDSDLKYSIHTHS